MKKPQSHDVTAVSGSCGYVPLVSRQSYRGSAAGTFFQLPGGNNNGMSPADGGAIGKTFELNLGGITSGENRE